MEMISVKETTMVPPAEDMPKESLWISNLDLARIRYHVLTLYFYKPNASFHFFQPQTLKEALAKTLVPFYPVAGRLSYDTNGRLEIMCNGEGVLFVNAETNSTIDDFIESFTNGSDVSCLVPKIDYSKGVSSYPLFASQVTVFKCGGVSLGVAFHHTVTDGASALNFMNSWADMAREGLPPKTTPFIDRTLLRAGVPPTPKFHHIEYDPRPTKLGAQPDSKPKSVVSFLKLTANQLKNLKARANENGTKYYSTYSALTAHVWRCATKARCLEREQQVQLIMPVDGRKRLHPPLPSGYLGNAIFYATPMALAGDVGSETFVDTINRVEESLKKMDSEYLRSAIDHLDKVPQFDHGPQTVGCPNLIVNSWEWLPLYDADFGWGYPALMGPINFGHEGRVFILPSPTKDGSLMLMVHLEAPHMKLFIKLFYEF